MQINGSGTFIVPWQQTKPSAITGTQQYSTFDRTKRFLQVVKAWDQFSITGVKIEYMPYYSQ